MCDVDFDSCYLIPISSITIIKPHCNDLVALLSEWPTSKGLVKNDNSVSHCEQIVLHTKLPSIPSDKGNGLDIYIDCAIGYSEQYVKEVFPNIRHVEIIQN